LIKFENGLLRRKSGPKKEKTKGVWKKKTA
jgi:hypothetical protein